MSGYTHEDGSEDTLEDLQTSGRCMAQALSFLLKETEGVCVELAFQEKYPNDEHGKFIVYAKDKMIRICKADDDKELTAGRFVWMES